MGGWRLHVIRPADQGHAESGSSSSSGAITLLFISPFRSMIPARNLNIYAEVDYEKLSRYGDVVAATIILSGLRSN